MIRKFLRVLLAKDPKIFVPTFLSKGWIDAKSIEPIQAMYLDPKFWVWESKWIPGVQSTFCAQDKQFWARDIMPPGSSAVGQRKKL